MEVENNLKTYFENEINKIEGNIDVEEAVMSKIATPRKRTVPTKVLSFAVVIILCIAGTGAVYGQEIVEHFTFTEGEFVNEQGHKEWEIVTTQEDLSFTDALDEVYNNLDLEEGQAVAIYDFSRYPIEKTIVKTEPVTVRDLELLNSYTINTLNINFDQEILEKYQFKYGTVSYSTGITDITSMREEAISTGNDIIVRDIEVNTDKVMIVSCDYIKNGQTDDTPYFFVQIFESHGNRIITNEEVEDELNYAEKVMIAGSEVLYETHPEYKKLEWIKNKYYYSVVSENTDMTKEELIEIGEQIKLKYK